MSDFLNCFSEEMNQTYSLYPKKTGLDIDDEVEQGFVDVPTIEDQKCGYYSASSVGSLISDRYKTEVTGVVISPVLSVESGSKLILSNVVEHIVVFADDVALQGEVLVIGVKAVNYGV